MKNIVLIITDTFRYDNLGSHAKRAVRTPELDRFAMERATAIERFYSGSFPTIPHRTDVATGVLGWPHYGWQPIDQSGPNHAAQILRKAGYASQLICDTPHLFRSRFQHGFDAAFQHRGQECDIALLHLNDPIEDVVPEAKTRTRPQFRGHTLANLHRWTNRYPRNEADTFPAKTGQTVIRWIEENSEANPFFLWVDFFDPHEPWDPPEYLVRKYAGAYDGIPMLHCNYGPSSAYTDEELRNLWAHYAAEAELVDRWVGRILQKVDDLALWDDTIVAITSDHGTSLGEHRRTGKSNIHDADPRYWPLYPEISHVPFLVAGGEVPPGQRLDVIAQPIDILPSLCELAGAEVEPDQPFQGRSFAGSVLDGGERHRDCAVAGCHIAVAADDADGGSRPNRCTTPFLYAGQWGYAPVGAFGRPELYDVSADPLAETDVAEAHPDVVADLHDRFIAYLREHDAPEAFVTLWSRDAGGADGGAWAIDYADDAL
ncbi:MAG: sulfatase [Candidatus Hydrogenedentes bacterium]|nr:sulfatase [Candidatus Hydrogenedentota bacterium]